MKKRGFTLIELLAVIVVLAIIALIATPIVMNVIKKAQQGAAERSAERYIDAVELAIATEGLDSTPIQDGTYVVDANGNLCLQGKTCTEPDLTVEVSGTKPAEGSKVVIANGLVVKDGTSVEYDNYTVTLDEFGKAGAVEKVEKVLTCLPLEDNELQYQYYQHIDNVMLDGTYTTGTKSVGDAYRCTVGKDLSYIFNILSVNEDDNTVTLLMNENLANDVTWCANGSDNSCNADGAYAALEASTAAWTNNKISVDLPSLSQIAVADGRDANSTYFVVSNHWLHSNLTSADDYWTTTKNGTNEANAIVCYGLAFNYSVSDKVGIRPTITIPAGEI